MMVDISCTNRATASTSIFGWYRWPANANRFPIPTGSSRGAFSPDGRWVAYVAQESGRPRSSWLRFRGPERSGKFSTEAAPRHGGAPTAKNFSTSISTASPRLRWRLRFRISVGNSKLLFRLPLRGMIAREYSPSGDGQRFIAVSPSEGGSQSLTLVQNWQAELKKK